MKIDAYHDPYDVWETRLGVASRERFYDGARGGKISAASLALLDWMLPKTSRRILRCRPRVHPITVAQAALAAERVDGIDDGAARSILAMLKELAATRGDEWSWGLGFRWMSKNGLYGPDVPFVTHTPYVMQALLVLMKHESTESEARSMFDATWGFLERLNVMAEDGGALALSYAPVDEPRVVVNANAYAAFAYALHAVHGRRAEIRQLAAEKTVRLARWVVEQQREDGSWFYYADDEPGNFIDCFHSCFVIKNLARAARLVPAALDIAQPACARGWSFVDERFYDRERGLCARFVSRDFRDPYRWDLYDQAEYMGLLVDFGQLTDALTFRKTVERTFRRGSNWWCRIDLVGRRWGKNFLRWGIVPFGLHSARLDAASRVDHTIDHSGNSAYEHAV